MERRNIIYYGAVNTEKRAERAKTRGCARGKKKDKKNVRKTFVYEEKWKVVEKKKNKLGCRFWKK